MTNIIVKAREKTFLPAIQGLRGLSALLVFVFHIYDMSRKQGFCPIHSEWALDLFRLGQHGVQIFFMISGFLIANSLINHANVWRFAMDRCIRIYPVFFFIHILSFSVGPWIGYKVFYHIGGFQWAQMFLENLFFLPGMLNLPLVQLNAWSLSFEACFYIVAASIYSFSIRFGRSGAWAFGILMTVPLLWFYPTAIFFAVGAMVFLYLRRIPNRPHTVTSTFALLAMLSVLLYVKDDRWGSYLAALPGLLAFWEVAEGKCILSEFLKTKPLQYFGKISYSFYLWHPMVTFPLKTICAKASLRYGDMRTFLLFGVIGFIGTVAVSHLSYHLLEVRVAGWLKQRFKKKDVQQAMPMVSA